MNNKINKYKNSYILVDINTLYCEKILNYLWKNNVRVKNIKRYNEALISFEIKMCDYNVLKEGVYRIGGRINIKKRQGVEFYLRRILNKKVLILGVFAFAAVLYYLNGFIWRITITTNEYLSPLEVRQILKSYNIDSGTKKSTIDLETLKKKIMKDMDSVMWVGGKIQGGNLDLKIVERQNPPEVRKVKTTGDVVAVRDGVIERIYTEGGTAVVEPGKTVKEGDVLIKGTQGKEEHEYSIQAEGTVMARTFYEESIRAPIKQLITRTTGKKVSNYYIKIKNIKIYLKNSLINMASYDKIEDNKGLIKSETYVEKVVEEKKTNVEEIKEQLQKKILLNLDKAVKIISISPDIKEENQEYVIKILVVAEENIAKKQVIDYNQEIINKGTL